MKPHSKDSIDELMAREEREKIPQKEEEEEEKEKEKIGAGKEGKETFTSKLWNAWISLPQNALKIVQWGAYMAQLVNLLI